MLICLKNITQRPVLELDLDSSALEKTHTQLNDTKRSKSGSPKYRVFQIWAPITESENESKDGHNNSSIEEQQRLEKDKYKLEVTHVLEDPKAYETG
jgi:hypothetical protein